MFMGKVNRTLHTPNRAMMKFCPFLPKVTVHSLQPRSVVSRTMWDLCIYNNEKHMHVVSSRDYEVIYRVTIFSNKEVGSIFH